MSRSRAGYGIVDGCALNVSLAGGIREPARPADKVLRASNTALKSARLVKPVPVNEEFTRSPLAATYAPVLLTMPGKMPLTGGPDGTG